jgi:hypothetical protein
MQVSRCEYKAKYDLVGYKHLGVEKRPMEFEVEKRVIENDKEVVKKVKMRVDRDLAVSSEKQTVIGRVSSLATESDCPKILTVHRKCIKSLKER